MYQATPVKTNLPPISWDSPQTTAHPTVLPLLVSQTPTLVPNHTGLFHRLSRLVQARSTPLNRASRQYTAALRQSSVMWSAGQKTSSRVRYLALLTTSLLFWSLLSWV